MDETSVNSFEKDHDLGEPDNLYMENTILINLFNQRYLITLACSRGKNVKTVMTKVLHAQYSSYGCQNGPSRDERMQIIPHPQCQLDGLTNGQFTVSHFGHAKLSYSKCKYKENLVISLSIGSYNKVKKQGWSPTPVDILVGN